jgi:hypothetical protein
MFIADSRYREHILTYTAEYPLSSLPGLWQPLIKEPIIGWTHISSSSFTAVLGYYPPCRDIDLFRRRSIKHVRRSLLECKMLVGSWLSDYIRRPFCNISSLHSLPTCLFINPYLPCARSWPLFVMEGEHLLVPSILGEKFKDKSKNAL